MDAAVRRPQDWATAFESGVKAVDRLHDFYVFAQFRNPQPPAADKHVIEALTEAGRCWPQISMSVTCSGLEELPKQRTESQVCRMARLSGN